MTKVQIFLRRSGEGMTPDPSASQRRSARSTAGEFTPVSLGCGSAAPPSSPQGRLEVELQLQQVLQIYLSNVVDDVPGGEACQGTNGFMTGCACCPQEGRMLGAAHTPETARIHVGRQVPQPAPAETTGELRRETCYRTVSHQSGG